VSLYVGVLAVQGAVSEHVDALQHAAKSSGLDVEVITVRTNDDLARVHGLVIPGGESTTISRLLRAGGLQEPIKARAGKDLAVFGTCAGLILLASDADHDVAEKDIQLLGLLDAKVDRNAFGRQRESFEGTVDVKEIGIMPAVFIRAPSLSSVHGGTEELARVDGRIVAARHGLVMGTAFHPELTPDTRLHERFLADAALAATNSD
jgi:5'-phosphate synthase pdxT subunit